MVFFRQVLTVNCNKEKLISTVASSTIDVTDTTSYGRAAEFRGEVWPDGFQVSLNTAYYNSFESHASAYVKSLGNNKCEVYLEIGVNVLIMILMGIWNVGVLVGLVVAAISVFSSGDLAELEWMLVFVPFIAADVLFLRFALYSNYKKLKYRILEFLDIR